MRGGPPRDCVSCGVKPIAWTNPRIDFCYDCLPGGPFTPPPCQRCGSSRDYYSAGLCARCHYFAPQRCDSCRDCYAWGVYRKHKWRCGGCTHWHAHFARGCCPICRRVVPISPAFGACRLCWRQGVMHNWVRAHLSLVEVNRAGQQLFLANLHVAAIRRNSRGSTHEGDDPRRPTEPWSFLAVEHRQLVLFEATRDLGIGVRTGFAEPADAAMATFLFEAIDEHANEHGWGIATVKGARRGIRILLATQDTPGAPIRASDVLALRGVGVPARGVLAVCDRVGLLEEDRTPPVFPWFEQHIAGLPEQMTAELRIWFRVMRHGSATPPRRHPRAETTLRLHLRWTLPTLHAWAGAGHASLREISREDVRAALPPAGNPRSTIGQGLRSIFTILKTEKVFFSNPIAGISTGAHESRYPMPAKIAAVRQALNSPRPAAALMAALVAFHGLGSGQLRALRLTDIYDGRLHLDSRTIVLADPVRVRLDAYLADRERTWPATTNPHLFIHQGTAGTNRAFGSRWAYLLLGMAPRVIREDRILHEIHATGGDIRRICDLFGLTVAGAKRYAATLDHPGLTAADGTATSTSR